MRRRVPKRHDRPSAAQRRQRARQQAQRDQLETLGRQSKPYAPHAIATLMFFGAALMMIVMEVPLLYALGGPMIATPFIYLILKTGRSPESLVQEMAQPPGDESAFRRR